MPYPPRPPTGQGAAAALKRAGLDRARVIPGTGRYRFDGKLIRGSEKHSEGWEVKTVNGAVHVMHRLGSDVTTGDLEKLKGRCQLKLLKYADVLSEAGFRSRLGDDGKALLVYGRWR